MSTTQDLPPHLYGRGNRHDMGVTLVIAAASALGRLTSHLSARGPERVEDAGRVLTVERRTRESLDGSVVGLVLTSPDGGPLPRWWPGAHLDVYLPSGAMRTYSLCGDHRDRNEYRIAVRRIDGGGGGSAEVHDVLQPGATVTVRGPRNAFPLAPPGAGSTARRLHFVAGGIGITPILAMVTLAESRGIDWSLVYTGRDAASLPFLDELARYEDHVTVLTDDRHGVPTAATLLAGVEAGDAVYCCGPPPMIAAVRAAVRALPETELHVERFSPAPVVDGAAFEVQLADGTLVDIPADRSVLDVLREGRPQVAHSCQQGFCGTCSVRVLAGEPEHRDTILTDEQHPDEMLICVSRAAAGTRLVLDL
ncbi:PDR/VanB family oxidoreductase [Jatrophihabitans sp.]|uniref:PDR/VanB family oxidoreductase n=1 Tax=Jatrophihabitans sp. TaxID=1932789 RepID=UPI0030C71938|nr:oxidoreductase [Jatrophihabitans sp.]